MPWEGGRIWCSDLSHCNILNVQFPTEYYKKYKETKKYGLYIGKKKLMETVLEEAQTLDLLNKDLKSSILSILKK